MSKSPPPECLNKCAFCRAGSRTGAAVRNQLARGPLESYALAGDWSCPFGRGEVGTIRNKAKAIGQSVAARITGRAQVPQETIAERWATCQSCEHSKDSKGTVCGKLRDALKPSSPTCGCIIANKIRVSSQACPLGKWLAINSPDLPNAGE